MAIRLNGIGEAAIADNQAFYQRWLGSDYDNASLYQAHYYLGLIAWQRQNTQQMQVHFEQACEKALQVFAHRAANQYTPKYSDKLVLPLLLLVSCGSDNQLTKLQRFPDSIFTDDYPEYRVNYFVRWLKNDALSCEEESVIYTRKKLATAFEKNEHIMMATHFIDGVIAAQNQDRTKVEQSIQDLLEQHQMAVEEGHLHRRFEGFICLWVTAFKRILQSYQITLPTNSIWVPDTENTP